ncbi:MAG: hypothetical protein HDR31_02400 [Mycoplasma sp.]|nr:hypothetical protein [Mycoplasma sp.]
MQNKNKVMNDYISFDKFQKLDFLNSIKDSFDIEQELIKDLLKQEVIQKIMKMKQKNPKQHLYYSTILLRLEGYTSQEISKKLNVSEKFVWNKYYSFIKKIKDEKIFN